MFHRYFYIFLLLIESGLLLADKGQVNLLIYGDSISAGYAMDKDKQWSEELQKILTEEKINLEIINKSLSGETTGGGLSRLEKVLDNSMPSYILIELGGNDALRGYPPAKIKNNIEQMINLSIKRGVKVFLMQIRILPNYGKRYQSSFESIYQDVAEENSIPLIPFMLNDIALNQNLMLDDGIHPNVSAQPLIAQFIYNNLLPLMSEVD
ncbi:arylesterase [Gammaproteobacteria bacterium]|nr:arylesterase [Gammaproteobacteria bacterium]